MGKKKLLVGAAVVVLVVAVVGLGVVIGRALGRKDQEGREG